MVELVCHHRKNQVPITADALPNSAHQLAVSPASDARFKIGRQIGSVHIPEPGTDPGEIEFASTSLRLRWTVTAVRSMTIPAEHRSLVQILASQNACRIQRRVHRHD